MKLTKLVSITDKSPEQVKQTFALIGSMIGASTRELPSAMELVVRLVEVIIDKYDSHIDVGSDLLDLAKAIRGLLEEQNEK